MQLLTLDSPVQETHSTTARQLAETATFQTTAVTFRAIARRLLAETDDHTRQDLAHAEHRVSEGLCATTKPPGTARETTRSAEPPETARTFGEARVPWLAMVQQTE
jgi:hypothetical protein